MALNSETEPDKYSTKEHQMKKVEFDQNKNLIVRSTLESHFFDF